MADSITLVLVLAREVVGLGPSRMVAEEAEAAGARRWRSLATAAERASEAADVRLERMRGTFDEFDLETLAFEADRAYAAAKGFDADVAALEAGRGVDGQSPGNVGALRLRATRHRALGALLAKLTARVVGPRY